MPYARKTYKARRRPTRRAPVRRRPTRNLRRVVQSVLNRNIETKNQIAVHASAAALGHNVPKLIASNLMRTTQGVTSDATSATRIGDRINPRGIKLYLQVRQHQPTSATNYENADIAIKLWMLKQHHSLINTSGDYLRTIVANNMMNPVDTKRATVVKTMTFKLKNMFSTWNASPTVESAPAFKTLTLWIPLAKYKQYLYQENTTDHGKYFDICFHAMAFSAHPDIVTDDHIANIDCSSEIFFKDP